MAQIMAIDYGKARTGIAVTDDMQIIASGLDTISTPKLLDFLKKYFSENEVATIVVGQPIDLRGNMSEVENDILKFVDEVRRLFPTLEIKRFDERFTSKMASYFISQSGKNKKQREQKSLIDKVSATIILQNYLDTIERVSFQLK